MSFLLLERILLQFDLIHLRFILFYFSNFTKLLVLLHSVELNVGNPNNQSMMNFVFHLPVLSMDPDWGSILVVLAIPMSSLWLLLLVCYELFLSIMWCLSLAMVVVLQWLWLLLIYLQLWLVQSHDFGNWLVSWYCSLEIGWYGVWCCSLMMVYILPMLYWFSCGCDLAELQWGSLWCLSSSIWTCARS